MKDGIPEPYDEEAGEALLLAGWRQGSALRLPPDVPCQIEIDRSSEWVVVCTQSCSVVSYRFDTDPVVELAVAKPVKKFKATAVEAKGKNFRRFHLPVAGVPGVEALDCDINRRFFVPRARFLTMTPEAGPTTEAIRAFGGWLARYFSRIALPNELVRRSKTAGGLFDQVKATLDASYRTGAMADYVDAIYVRWMPDYELAAGGPYRLDLLFLCADIPATNDFELAVAEGLDEFAEPAGKDGIVLTWSVGERSSTTLGLVAGYSRLSEWDYLSNLGTVAGDSDKISI